jgi:hypothetical protein
LPGTLPDNIFKHDVLFPYFLTLLGINMLAKKTTKNQITLPKAIVSRFPDVDYFDVREEDGRIVLVPLRPSRADEVRTKLASLGIQESDVADALAWVRR